MPFRENFVFFKFCSSFVCHDSHLDRFEKSQLSYGLFEYASVINLICTIFLVPFMSHIYCLYHARTKTTTMISLWEKLFHHTVMTQTFSTRGCQHSNVLPLDFFLLFYLRYASLIPPNFFGNVTNNRINRSVLKNISS